MEERGRGQSLRNQMLRHVADQALQDDDVAAALEKLVVAEDKRERLVCKTRPLDYLDRT